MLVIVRLFVIVQKCPPRYLVQKDLPHLLSLDVVLVDFPYHFLGSPYVTRKFKLNLKNLFRIYLYVIPGQTSC